jgi:membrane protein
LVVSLGLAIWSATSGTTILMQTLTIAYEEPEDRGILAFYGTAIAFTIGLIVFVVLSLALVAGVPAVLEWLPMPQEWRDTLSLVRWVILAVLVLIGLGLLYRFAPCRHEPDWEWLTPGTITAAALWLIGSAGFSFYVARFGSYDRTYGSIGAVVVLLLWFYLTGYIILIGAELNSEIDKVRRLRRSAGTTGEAGPVWSPP